MEDIIKTVFKMLSDKTYLCIIGCYFVLFMIFSGIVILYVKTKLDALKIKCSEEVKKVKKLLNMESKLDFFMAHYGSLEFLMHQMDGSFSFIEMLKSKIRRVAGKLTTEVNIEAVNKFYLEALGVISTAMIDENQKVYFGYLLDNLSDFVLDLEKTAKNNRTKEHAETCEVILLSVLEYFKIHLIEIQEMSEAEVKEFLTKYYDSYTTKTEEQETKIRDLLKYM